MGRITPSFRQLYEETISELKMELQAALVDLGHKNAFDLLLKEAWNSEQAAMGNSTLPTVCDKLNIMASIHNRKLIAALFLCMDWLSPVFLSTTKHFLHQAVVRIAMKKESYFDRCNH
jgi:hypothetical protein